MRCARAERIVAPGLVIVHHIHVKALAARLILTPRRLGCDSWRGRITALRAQLALQQALPAPQNDSSGMRCDDRCSQTLKTGCMNPPCTPWQVQQQGKSAEALACVCPGGQMRCSVEHRACTLRQSAEPNAARTC